MSKLAISTEFLVISAGKDDQVVSGNRLVFVEEGGYVQLIEAAVAVLEPGAEADSFSRETLTICMPGATADVSRGGRVIHVSDDTVLLLPGDRIDLSLGQKFVALPGAILTNGRREVEQILTADGVLRVCMEAVVEDSDWDD